MTSEQFKGPRRGFGPEGSKGKPGRDAFVTGAAETDNHSEVGFIDPNLGAVKARETLSMPAKSRLYGMCTSTAIKQTT